MAERMYTQKELNEAVSLAVERTKQNMQEGRIPTAENIALRKALLVLLLTPSIRLCLDTVDPKAVEQAEKALELAEGTQITLTCTTCPNQFSAPITDPISYNIRKQCPTCREGGV
jgi:hypothetical protein